MDVFSHHINGFNVHILEEIFTMLTPVATETVNQVTTKRNKLSQTMI